MGKACNWNGKNEIYIIPLRGSINRWENYIKMDIKEI
jgi:hypothetical protein